MTALLVDLHNLVHRAMHAYEELHSSSGVKTGAIYGVLHMMERYVDEIQPDAVWFISDPIRSAGSPDPEAPAWRGKVFAGYKNRTVKRTEEQEQKYHAVREQLPIIRDMLRSLNCVWLEQAGMEADDIAGWLCQQFKDSAKILLSTDKDMLQLVDDTTSVYYPGRPQRLFTRDSFVEQSSYLFPSNKKKTADTLFRVTPAQWLEYRLLTGDPSDTIDGLPKCGEIRAIEIIRAGGYYAWCQQQGPKSGKLAQQVSSADSQAIYERNRILMGLSPPQSPHPFSMTNPRCFMGTARMEILDWLKQLDVSDREGGLIFRLRRSPLLKQLKPYASLRSW